jgi:energy-coupling factor transport system ATP-binding protein
MLDPISRSDFMRLVQELIREHGLTLINITHNMEEALLADQVYVMAEGRIVLTGTPQAVFDQVDLIKQEGLDVPVHTEIAHAVAGLLQTQLLPMEASSWDGAVQAVLRILAAARQRVSCSNWRPQLPDLAHVSLPADAPLVVAVNNLSFTYDPGTPLASPALRQVSFNVRRGELLGIIGHSGSGKSTLIQHLNGLLRGQKGQVSVLGMDCATGSDIRKIRQRVGLLFQYPEHQLFEETVFQDIAFGPKRMGLDMNEIEPRVLKAAKIVGLNQEELERSPFELSGGQKRRAAIAGILAMEPEILILDEPAAGLDPAGRDEILGYADRLRAMGVTVILVSHSMEDIARLADRVLVLRQGAVQAFGEPAEVFADEHKLADTGLSLPRTTAFLREIHRHLPGLACDCYQPDLAARNLVRAGLAGCPTAGGEVYNA